MGEKKDILREIDKEIRDILYRYIKTQSFTYTEREKEAEQFLMGHLSEIPYFKENPQYYGTYPIPGDSFGRAVCYAMVKGRGDDTVVFVHHNDVVEIEDFKLLKSYAFSPDELAQELYKIKDSLPSDARKDLEDDTFLFGRGTADMKGGGAIQLALLRRYSELKDFKGNVIVIAVPDEENLSAGMRAAVKLLEELKNTYGLNYKIMINSEPHQRKDFTQGIFSEGSVGKLMPFVYVRGYLSHIGKVFEGFNPLNLMSEIVRSTELNMDFCDAMGAESAPPPTWLYLKDSKKQYDVSMPLSASGCFSILTLDQTPAEVMEKVETVCTKAFGKILEEMNESYARFCQVAEPVAKELPWKVKVTDFASLCEEAAGAHGAAFRENYEKKVAHLSQSMREGTINIIESNFALVEFVFDYIEDLSPRVVCGLIPPYYPNVSNLYFEKLDPQVKTLAQDLDAYTWETYRQHYTKEYFYTGISDLSYTSIREGNRTLEALERSMPLFGDFYSIPVAAIETITMPCMNIGPWGKDFHKLTERVCREDLFERTPRIINKAVSLLLDDPSLA
ncbi:M20/M25/M40 family metallo-hydrolase [Anaerovorax odorimutans]|uniref:M20/M25/M40 family metallo-hydrolase n=1 Tax=Anaerovorax odorimutans TaxID=109327 RepID=A0ABT1RSW1_9FIRM|nr:M20/M25/M40 family metallo-hydrolase [Anaerovorax odorimutans]MCQ4638293.1 M20/M25/M40 family metallo-hydrolase [Anaerovorax odorimutans]